MKKTGKPGGKGAAPKIAFLILLTSVLVLLAYPDEPFTASARTSLPKLECPLVASCPVAALPPVAPSPSASETAQAAGPNLSPPSSVKMTIEAGLGEGNFIRGGTWLPVSISLSNSGESIQGEINIYVSPGQISSGSGTRAIPLYTSRYIQVVNLPHGGSKQITMFVPYAATELFNRTVEVELNGVQGTDGAGSRTLAFAKAGFTPLLNQLLVGYFASNPDALRGFNDLALLSPNQGKTSPARRLLFSPLTPDKLPDISQALASLSVLAFQNYDSASLSAEQWKAVESWVRQGGVLLLSGGTGAGRVLKGVPSELVPAELVGTSSASLVEFDQPSLFALQKLGGSPLPEGTPGGKSLLSRLTPTRGGSILLGGNAGNLPLAIELKKGAGAVIMTAFDLGEPRFTNWSGVPFLWETLIGRYQTALQQFGPYSTYGINSSSLVAGSLTGVLSNIPGVGIPSLKLAAFLALIYIGVAGPGNFFVLKMIRKLEWSWFTLPLLIILCSGLIYFFALKDKGSEVLTSSVSIVHLTQNDNNGNAPFQKPVLSLEGVFTPNDNSYVLAFPPGSLISAIPNYLPQPMSAPPFQAGSNQNFPSSASLSGIPPVGLQIVQGDRPQVNLLGMPQWSFRSIVAEGSLKMPGGLSGRFVQASGTLSGTLTNSTGRLLTDVIVLSAFGMRRVGDLAPGQSVRVNFENLFGTPSPLYTLYQSSQTPVFRSSFPAAPSSTSQSERLQTRQRDLLNNLSTSLPIFSPANYGLSLPTENVVPVVAIGWSDKPLLDYTVNGRTIGGNDLSVFVSELNLDLKASTQLLPGINFGKVSARPPSLTVPSGNTSGGGSSLPLVPSGGAALENGSLTVEYTLAELAQSLQNFHNGEGKIEKLVIDLPVRSVNRSGFGPIQSPNFNAELYNYRLAKWEAVPVVLAPSICYSEIPAFGGGPITSNIASFIPQSGVNSQNCLASFRGTALPPASPPLSSPAASSPAPGPTSAATLSGPNPSVTYGIPTPTPASQAYYSGGVPEGFIVLGAGSGFDPEHYLSPEGTLKLRLSRDDKNSDIVYFNYFSVGYDLTPVKK